MYILLDARTRRNKLTKFIQDMGLGKTLSVLALICSSLDLQSDQIAKSSDSTPTATLIITPKSSTRDHY